MSRNMFAYLTLTSAGSPEAAKERPEQVVKTALHGPTKTENNISQPLKKRVAAWSS